MEKKTNITKLIDNINNENIENEKEKIESHLFDWNDVNLDKNEEKTNIIIKELSTNTQIKIEDDYIK